MGSRGSQKSFTFVTAQSCNMCGSGPEHQVFYGRRLNRRQGLWPKWKPGICIPIYKCKNCELLYPNPMPLPLSLDQHYDIPPEEYWVDEYFRSIPPIDHHIVNKFKELYGPDYQGKRFLEVGCGIGKWMRTFTNVGMDCYGIEPSNSFRNAAIEKNGIEPDKIQLSSIEAATFPDEHFAFVNFGAVLEHFADPAGAISKSLPWLEKGGVIHAEIPSSRFLQARLIRLFYRLTFSGEYVINTSPMHSPFHLYEFGLESFSKHGQRAGYSVVFHEYYPCSHSRSKAIDYLFDKWMKYTSTGMQLAVWLRRSDSAEG